MPRLKAYQVCEGDEGHAVIEFATSNAAARRNGANELGIEWESVESCRRSPGFDSFAPGPVPPSELLRAGWWQECLHCRQRIDFGIEENDFGEPLEFDPVDHGTHVFCRPACRDAHLAPKAAPQ